MEQHTVAIYPGMFDPVHNGHLDVVGDASQIFSKVIWAVGINPTKKPMFTLEQRSEMMKLANKFPNVELSQFSGLLVRFAESIGAKFIVRSLRMTMDFEYEFQMSLINKQIAPSLTTIYLPARQEHFHMSSTAVRELILNNEAVDGYLPNNVRDFIKNIRA
ncbi:MAG: pantetheine-phosphate adenylyltransferase [Candidatus Yanofskybacteria bacterium]|nr:pantetheine-phosphate adenylyltransferase [Candidatus Yanofskybacteria bacterium]